MIGAGELAGVIAELGRPHELRGVVRRSGSGYRMRVPAGMALPPLGGYAVTVGRDAAESIPARAVLGADLEVLPDESAPDLDGWLIRVRFGKAASEGSTDPGVRPAAAEQGD